MRWRVFRVTTSKSSSKLLKRALQNGSFNFGKMSKSGGFKLGLYGIWRSVSHCNEQINQKLVVQHAGVHYRAILTHYCLFFQAEVFEFVGAILNE